MSEAHQEWLDRLDAQARDKQKAFMEGIAARLRRPRVLEQPNHPAQGAPDFWNAFTLLREERIERFSGNWRSAGGHVLRVGTMEEAKQKVAAIASERQARCIIRQNQAELHAFDLEHALTGTSVVVWNSKAGENWKARAAEADIGLVVADYAVAHTGTVVAMSSADKGRAVSLLPPACIVIVPVERLKTRLGEVMAELGRQERSHLPAGVHFISGPSRSADIENDLTIGVHGPGVVYAVLVG